MVFHGLEVGVLVVFDIPYSDDGVSASCVKSVKGNRNNLVHLLTVKTVPFNSKRTYTRYD